MFNVHISQFALFLYIFFSLNCCVSLNHWYLWHCCCHGASPSSFYRTSRSSAALKSRRTTIRSNRSSCLWTQTALLPQPLLNTRPVVGWRWRQTCDKTATDAVGNMVFLFGSILSLLLLLHMHFESSKWFDQPVRSATCKINWAEQMSLLKIFNLIIRV